jgi:hypothetical protein
VPPSPVISRSARILRPQAVSLREGHEVDSLSQFGGFVAKFDLRAYARQGAAVRVTELREELASIYKAFPELRKGNLDDPFTRRTRAAKDGGVGIGNGRKRKRRGMTAAQKAEVSKRMKKYWATRRAKKGG